MSGKVTQCLGIDQSGCQQLKGNPYHKKIRHSRLKSKSLLIIDNSNQVYYPTKIKTVPVVKTSVSLERHVTEPLTNPRIVGRRVRGCRGLGVCVWKGRKDPTTPHRSSVGPLTTNVEIGFLIKTGSSETVY